MDSQSPSIPSKKPDHKKMKNGEAPWRIIQGIFMALILWYMNQTTGSIKDNAQMLAEHESTEIHETPEQKQNRIDARIAEKLRVIDVKLDP